jgi:type VI secretion system protein ImpG
MITPGQEKFLTYYHRELKYLRQGGQIFSQAHPKIARRLQLGTESPDPHTERLLESFAFMTARLSQEIDDRLPQISAVLLGILYPYLVSPVPSLSVAQFVVDPLKGKLTTGALIPKHTPLFTYAEEGVACRFRTAYPVTLWPLTVISAEFTQAESEVFLNTTQKAPWYLRVRLRADGLDFSDLDLSTLRFFIGGDRGTSFHIYDMLCAQSQIQVLTLTQGNILKELPEGSFQPVGFRMDEGLLPSTDHAHPAYQMLHEYFHFPEKYLFFDIQNLNLKDGDAFADILIGIKDTWEIDKMSISAENFKLGCTPIVNLFPKTTDPLRIDHRKFEYRLVADQRRERTTEIYSIDRVNLSQDINAPAETLIPYFSFEHGAHEQIPEIYWLSRRVSSEKRDVPGTDIYLNFVDLKFNPTLPASQIVFAQTLCTNRFLAEQVPEGGVLQVEEEFPASKIVCLMQPTPQVYSPVDGETLWRLISQLAINHLSLSTGDSAVKAVKETLRLYAGYTPRHIFTEIQALEGLKTQQTTRRLGHEAWRGFANGLHITLTVNERSCTGGSIFLLASVLRHFFALQTSVNSFVEVQLNSIQRQGEWMKWQPLHGDQIIL